MILLGQHGLQQDYYMGLEYIRVAAQTCDQNAPQGAYVRVALDYLLAISSPWPFFFFIFLTMTLQVYGMLLAGELPQVAIPENIFSYDLHAARVNVEKAAYNGFAKAQVKMGAAYELCQLGCDFDPTLSLHYNALAARQGEPDAEMALSKWFLCGHEGLFEKDDEIAFSYAQRAAQSGNATAEFALGYFCEVGIYVPVNIKEARAWYSKAAVAGNKDAAGRIESISRSKTLSRKDHETVAIARIKSRYGSEAGMTPMPRKKPLPPRNPLPPPIEQLEMPDPSKMSISDPPLSAPPTPYYNVPSHPGYPTDDHRPNSAFAFDPRMRPNPPGYGPPPPPKTSHSPSYGAGPTVPSVGYQRPPPPQGPANHGPMGGRGGPPKLDIGYSAPLETGSRFNGPDRRYAKSPGNTHPPSGTPQIPRLETAPPPAPRPSAPSTTTKTAPPQSKPSPKPSPRPSPRPSPKPNVQPPGPSVQPSRPGHGPVPGKGGLPGKGPKTFDEMGVPATKSNADCVCSPLLF